MSVAAANYIHHSRPTLAPADDRAVAEQLGSGQLAAGPAKRAFEAELGARLGVDGRHVLATGSGTFALYASLALGGVRAGGRVAMPTYACRALADAALALGAEPVVIDVDEDYGLEFDAVRAAHAEAPLAAVVVVHPLGRRVALEPFASLGTFVVEDCAHALPAAGPSAAGASVFSFHATKLLAAGEGGAVVVHDGAAQEELERARTRPATALPMIVPMSDLAASLAREQLGALDRHLERRRELAALYDRLLPDDLDRLRFGDDETPFRYVVRTEQPLPTLRERMEGRGIAIRRPVDPLLHHQLGLPSDRYPVAERLYGRTVSLPLYPELTTSDVERIAEAFVDSLAPTP